MNSRKLAAFNEDFFSLLIQNRWHKKLNITKELLKACIVLAERSLFSDSEIHPAIKTQKSTPRLIDTLLIFFWFSSYSFSAYLLNVALRFTMLIKGRQWKPSKANFYSFSPSGAAFELYLKNAAQHKGVAVCILSPNRWRDLFTKNSADLVYETMLSINPLEWLSNFYLLSRNITLIDSQVSFDSSSRQKVIARFFYVILKQLCMRGRATKIILSMNDRSTPIVLNSESISYLFVEKLRNQGYKVCHHLHGMTLCNNLLNEPSISEYVITAGVREKTIYKNKNSFDSTIPFQMYEYAIASSKTSSNKDYRYDILLIGSFELPFIQKSTYNILKEAFKKNANSKVLLRHHPRAPSSSKRFLELNIPYEKVSENKELIKDVSLCKVVVCCSIDALIIPVLMKKPTIFLPMTDGDYSFYTKPFIDILPNLWCPGSSEELINHIRQALSSPPPPLPSNYEEIIEYLFGSFDIKAFYRAIKSIAEEKSND